MNTMVNVMAKIVNGPDKLALASGWVAAFDRNNPVYPSFTVRFEDKPQAYSQKLIRVVIVELLHEDGSGQSFCLSGNLESPITIGTLEYYCFSACYDARNRTGTITFKD